MGLITQVRQGEDKPAVVGISGKPIAYHESPHKKYYIDKVTF